MSGLLTKLCYSRGQNCTCPTVDSNCPGCDYARYTAFLRGIAIELRMRGLR